MSWTTTVGRTRLLLRPAAAGFRIARPLCAVRSVSSGAYLEGPKETIPQHFAGIVGQYGDRTAVVSSHQNTRLTYSALDRDSNALARGLEKLGVSKGSRVAVSLGNNIEFATLTYACFKLGAILAPLNPAFTAGQVAAAINHLESTHLVIGAENNLPRRDPVPNLLTLQALVPDLTSNKLQSEATPSLRAIVIVDNSAGRVDVASLRATTPYASVLEDGGAGRALTKDLDAHDVVNIQFTSGTTSMPKAACLTHRSILNNGAAIGGRLGLSADDVVVCPPPLFHCFGAVLGYMATATHGAAIVFPAEAFDALATLRATAAERASALYGVPTMFLAVLEALAARPELAPPAALQRLRTGIAAGSQVPEPLMRRLHAELGLAGLTICYGMTETSPVSAMTAPDDPLAMRVASVGRLLPHVRARIVDPADPAVLPERNLPPGVPGELLVGGYLVMKEYWDDAARTAAARAVDADGVAWMRTGDEAVFDSDGFVAVTGRLKDVVVRGGENIHPRDVEDCLLTWAALRESCAFAVPDERYGEVVGAAVVRKDGEEVQGEDVRSWVRERLPRHFVPKHVFFLDSLPKTPSGKIQRFKLQEMAVKELGLHKGA